MNHVDGFRHVHITALALHAHYRLHPLAKVGCARARGVVLAREPANTGPAERIPAFPHRTLQLRQVQNRLRGALSDSSPLTWPVSICTRSAPQRQQMRSPGGTSPARRQRVVPRPAKKPTISD
jgi:hypothetical protein